MKINTPIDGARAVITARSQETGDATIERFVAHATRLYEQGRLERIKAPLLRMYVRRWRGRAKSGVVEINADFTSSLRQAICDGLASF